MKLKCIFHLPTLEIFKLILNSVSYLKTIMKFFDPKIILRKKIRLGIL